MFASEVRDLLTIRYPDREEIGWEFYRKLVKAYDYAFMNEGISKKRTLKDKELASKVLNKNGIEGISYYGKDSGAKRNFKDRECFVIFNKSAIKILDRLSRVDGEWQSKY